VLILFMLAAFAMDAVGIHAVFGGFVLGAVMPRGRLADELRRMLEPVTVVLLLPMFFTFSGLNTQLSLVADPALLGVAAAILALPSRQGGRLLGGGPAHRPGQSDRMGSAR
jgi:Kef-type K+ transport system membrane component KefB